MSNRTSTIAKIIKPHKETEPPWQGNEGDKFFFHEVNMANGDSGRLRVPASHGVRPAWLKEGQQITYAYNEGKLRLVSVHGERRESSSDDTGEQSNDFKGKGKKSGWGARLEDQVEFWLKRQKCISANTSLDRANRLVETGRIELKEKYNEALKDYNFILKLSDIDAPVKMNAPADSVNTKAEVSKSTPDKKESQAALFAEENMIDAPIPQFIQEALNNCDTPKKLKILRGQLRPDETNNKNIYRAIQKKESELKPKK